MYIRHMQTAIDHMGPENKLLSKGNSWHLSAILLHTNSTQCKLIIHSEIVGLNNTFAPVGTDVFILEMKTGDIINCLSFHHPHQHSHHGNLIGLIMSRVCLIGQKREPEMLWSVVDLSWEPWLFPIRSALLCSIPACPELWLAALPMERESANKNLRNPPPYSVAML